MKSSLPKPEVLLLASTHSRRELVLGVVIHRRLSVDDHRFGSVTPNLDVLIIAIFGMPRRCQRAELFAACMLKAL